MPISNKQKQIMAFPYSKYDAIICDGAIRSGKTVFMMLSFVDDAMRRYSNQRFGICGKTVDSTVKNIIEPYMGLAWAREKYREAMENAQTDEAKAAFEAKYQKKAALLQQQNKAYNQYCEDTGLKKQSDRITIAKWDRSQAAKATAAARKYSKDLAIRENYGKMVAEIKENGLLPKNAAVNIPPRAIDAKSLSFDDAHINAERGHDVTREMAEAWIKESKMSATVWNGKFERYYSQNGATYVDTVEKEIRTAFSKQEFDEKTIGIMEALEKYGY